MNDSQKSIQEKINDQNLSPEDAYRLMQARGLGDIEAIRLLREIFNLDLVEAKNVTVTAATGLSPKEHAENLAVGLEQVLRHDEADKRSESERRP